MDNSVFARGLVMNKYGRYNWVYGKHVYDDETETSFISGHNADGTFYEFEVVPFTIGCNLNITDVNGKEIFEGDVCRCDNIIFLAYKQMDEMLAGMLLGGEAEIIGNIHDDDNLRKLLGAPDFWSDF